MSGRPVLNAVRLELRLLMRGLVLPICLVIFALLAIANVNTQVSAVRADYSLVQHTRAEYQANGLDFTAALSQPLGLTTTPNGQTVTNLARYDYDTMAGSIVALSPASSVSQSLTYFGFIFFPVLFFLLGLWMSTAQR